MKFIKIFNKAAKIGILTGAAGVAAVLIAGAATVAISQKAEASPANAKKTGLPCAKCHTKPPELNSYGRSWKAKNVK